MKSRVTVQSIEIGISGNDRTKSAEITVWGDVRVICPLCSASVKNASHFCNKEPISKLTSPQRKMIAQLARHHGSGYGNASTGLSLSRNGYVTVDVENHYQLTPKGFTAAAEIAKAGQP